MTQEYGKRQVSIMHEPLFLSQIWRSERKEAHDHRPLDRPGPVGAGISLDRVSEGLYAPGRTQAIYGLGGRRASQVGALYRHGRNAGRARTSPAEAHKD